MSLYASPDQRGVCVLSVSLAPQRALGGDKAQIWNGCLVQLQHFQGLCSSSYETSQLEGQKLSLLFQVGVDQSQICPCYATYPL